MAIIPAARRSTAGYAAYAAAVLFAPHLVTYLVPSIWGATLATGVAVVVPLAVIAVAQHLVVFPVVAALPTPR